MRVEAGDIQPPSLLRGAKQGLGSTIAGSVFAILVHGLIVVVAIGLTRAEASSEPRKSYIEEHVIAASFVQLGKRPDPKRLPQRRVPRKTTAPIDSIAVSKNMNPPKPKKPKEEQPKEAEEDLLTRLGDRAKAFAEIAEQQEREGDPEGLIDGTETEAKAGDLYAGMLKSFFKRGWTIPNTLTDTDGLVTVAVVELTLDLHVGPHRIIKSSGVPLFDQSVEDRFNQLRTQGTTLPEPPPEVANQFLGHKITIRFRP